jgi:hypothetical protein
MAELREQRDGPTPPRNTTEPCWTCADAGGALGYDVFCNISRERRDQYPGFRPITFPSTAIMPCWRAR